MAGSSRALPSILDAIGGTPLVALRQVVPAGAGRVLVKVEATNPSGSMKDRMALAMIEAAERDGRLPAGGRVVEYTGGSTGAHRIEGVGAGFVVPQWNPALADEIATVSTDEAMAMCRRLAVAEALFAGTSTGANVRVAIDVATRLGPGSLTVTVACDTGMKYLRTGPFGE